MRDPADLRNKEDNAGGGGNPLEKCRFASLLCGYGQRRSQVEGGSEVPR